MAIFGDGFIKPKSVIRLWGDCPLVSCRMRTEAGKMPESFIFPIGNRPGESLMADWG